MVVESRIAQYINDRGIRRSFIAERTGLGRDVFNNILLGRRKLSIDEFQKVCIVMKVDPLLFLDYIEETKEGDKLHESPIVTQGCVDSQGSEE